MKIVSISEGTVRGALHLPASARDGIVLTHGAGGNFEMPLLLAIADAFVKQDVAVLRCDLPFRQKRRFGAPSPSGAAADRAGLADAVKFMRKTVAGRVLLSGQSYGGRQATMLEAEVPGTAGGLLLFSYPLHPPGKPTQLRTAHFPSLRTKAIFVHGTKDPFGSIEEMESALLLIPVPATLVRIEGAGHDLKRGKFELDPIVQLAISA